jgi:DNA-directed RNA polymerase specialized sigma24 family protein
MQKKKGYKRVNLNFDTSSYQFINLDLEIAVSRLQSRDREIIILYLMGHKQKDIAKIVKLERSMISKRLKTITNMLSTMMRTYRE